jgi:hypothetical protein
VPFSSATRVAGALVAVALATAIVVILAFGGEIEDLGPVIVFSILGATVVACLADSDGLA